MSVQDVISVSVLHVGLVLLQRVYLKEIYMLARGATQRKNGVDMSLGAKMNLFIYGTLRVGGALHSGFQMRGMEPIGLFKTEPTYTLYDVGCPLLSEVGETSVVGEIYRIQSLDDVIDIHNMEVRAGYSLTPVRLLDFKDPVFSWVQEPGERFAWAPSVPCGDWIAFREREAIAYVGKGRSDTV